jgi:hypothetical protein
MSENHDEKRREFLRSVLRWTILGGAVAGVGALASKRGESCVNQGVCRGCAAFDGCGLPQALSAKEVQGRTGHVG